MVTAACMPRLTAVAHHALALEHNSNNPRFIQRHCPPFRLVSFLAALDFNHRSFEHGCTPVHTLAFPLAPLLLLTPAQTCTSKLKWCAYLLAAPRAGVFSLPPQSFFQHRISVLFAINARLMPPVLRHSVCCSHTRLPLCNSCARAACFCCVCNAAAIALGCVFI
jgi:hypothetical protein